jgi:hypothetical protein
MAKFTKKQIEEINKNLPAFRSELHELMQKHFMNDIRMLNMTVEPVMGVKGFDECTPPQPCTGGKVAKLKIGPGGKISCKCVNPQIE